jgi:hypothetical protein
VRYDGVQHECLHAVRVLQAVLRGGEAAVRRAVERQPVHVEGLPQLLDVVDGVGRAVVPGFIADLPGALIDRLG